MSIEALNAMAQRATDDPEFAAKLKACGSPDDVLSVVAAEGFDVTINDLKVCAQQAAAQDLSDDQLDEVSGGLGFTVVAVSTVLVGLMGAAIGGLVGGVADLAVSAFGSSSGTENKG